MTRDESISQLSCLLREAEMMHRSDPEDDIWAADVAALKIAIEAMNEKKLLSDWISVDDSLPESEDDVLVCTRSKNGSRGIDKGYFLDSHFVHRGCAEATHWTPMPELPKEENSK